MIGVLRRIIGMPGLDYERRPEPLRGGFWAELLSFSLASPPDGWPADLVARLMPDPGAAREETIVQRAVAAAGFPTPLVRAAGGPDCGLGRAFMVMDRAPGAPVLSSLDGGLTPATVRRLLREIPDLPATSMARLHALDPDLVRGELKQVRDVPVTVDGLLSALARFAAELSRQDLAGAARWLADHRPGPAPDVICHGDLHPFNLLADGGRVTVLDWSTALLAPRAHDVGFTSLLLGEPPLRVPGWQRPLVRAVGRLMAASGQCGALTVARAGRFAGRAAGLEVDLRCTSHGPWGGSHGGLSCWAPAGRARWLSGRLRLVQFMIWLC
jgi:aminoglycoside phosphotransferase (APT) family kinase protein